MRKRRALTESSQPLPDALDTLSRLLLTRPGPAAAESLPEARAPLLRLLRLLGLLPLLEPRHATADHAAPQDAAKTATARPGAQTAAGAPDGGANHAPVQCSVPSSSADGYRQESGALMMLAVRRRTLISLPFTTAQCVDIVMCSPQT